MDVDGDADACAPDGAEPKKDRLANAGSVGDGVVYEIPYAEAQNTLNPDVTAAIARFRDVDPHSLDQLEAAITTHAGDFAESHLMHSVDGITAEVISADTMGGTLADTTNNEAWDFAVGDHLYQVKAQAPLRRL